jgi:hypothetical protein
MDPHPHNNPAYQDKLLNAFVVARGKNQLMIIEDTLENDFKQELKKTRNWFYFAGFGSGVLAYLLDRRYFQPAFGDRMFMRVNCMIGVILLGPSLIMQFRDKERPKELTRKVAFKYENQLVRLHPELQLYWQVYQNPSSFISSSNTAPIYPNPTAPSLSSTLQSPSMSPSIPPNMPPNMPPAYTPAPSQNIPEVSSYTYPSYTARPENSTQEVKNKSGYSDYFPPK